MEGTDKKKVMLGMSGGLDSTMSALLLMEQGYEVIGVTFKFWDSGKLNFIDEAKHLADKLQIHHIVEDRSLQFKREVIDRFAEEYFCGSTPSACPFCNQHMKFPTLENVARANGCDFIATGHYVRKVYHQGRYFVRKGKDSVKDQSYFLWRLGQGILEKWLTPLGEYTKNEVRVMAAHRGLTELTTKKESMGVCFLQDTDYRTFLNQHYPERTGKVEKGTVKDMQGNIIGWHNGFPYYTIGQQRGLNLEVDSKMAVRIIDTNTNTLFVDHPDALYATRFMVNALQVHDWDELLNADDITVKIRGVGRNPELPVQVKKIADDLLEIKLGDLAWALAPGQPVVFYRGERLIGGGLMVVI